MGSRPPLRTLFALVIFTVSFLFSSNLFAGEYVWTQRQPAGDVDRAWREAALDSDGSNLIVGVGTTGRLYTSSNSGANWAERQPAGDVNANWYIVDSDDDGSNLLAGAFGGRLYTSSDSGANWTERQPVGNFNINWNAGASDSTGTNLIVAVSNGRLYTSSNSGADWTERQPAGAANRAWTDVDSDADGSNLIASILGSQGRIWISTDYGVNWAESQPVGAVVKSWSAVATDADGSNLIAAIGSGRLYTSSNGGTNWTERQPAGDTDQYWSNVASDSTGTRLLAAAGNGGNFGEVYFSNDSGVTWEMYQPAGDIDAQWRALALDADGSHAVAGIFNNDGTGRLYTGLFDESPTVSVTEPADEDFVRGTIDLTADASDDVSVSGVQFKRDTNTLIGSEDTSSPYSVSFDTTAITDGEYDIIVVARDSLGNHATSTAVTITIDNTAPTVSITTPTEGETLPEWADSTVSWGDSDTCEYKLDTDSYTTVACTSPVTIPTPAEGAHTLTIRGTDEAGNVTTSTAVAFTYEIPVAAGGITSSGSTGQRRRELLAENAIQNKTSAVEAMIQALTAHVAVLQNLLNNLQPTTDSTFTRDLSLNSTGEDVRSLQKFLNSKGFTVATTGPGSAGNETSIFGPATEAALIRYQQANNITPAVGYFGPITRATAR